MAPRAMRLVAGLCLSTALWTAGADRPFARQQAPPAGADAILAATRQALGGEQKLSAIRSFTATGRTRQVRGNNLVPIEFEIWCELPDRFVRRDEIPAQESGPTASGFNGEALVQVPPMPAMPPTPPATAKGGGAAASPAPVSSGGAVVATTAQAPAGVGPAAGPGGAGAPLTAPPDPRKARVTSLKQDFVRLTLGMFSTSFPSYPLTFSVAGRAEAPQGTAEILDVKGPGTFALRFFIASDTHLPIMVSWTVPATNAVLAVQGQPPPENLPPGSVVVPVPPLPSTTASKEEQERYTKDVQDLRRKALAGAKVEHRLYYADYRDVGGGVRFPFRLRRAIGGETTEETNFDAFKINARIDARKFEAK